MIILLFGYNIKKVDFLIIYIKTIKKRNLDNMISIKVKTLTNKLYTIKVDISDVVLINEIKKKISEIHDQKLDSYNYKIIYLGRVLEDGYIIDNTFDNCLFILMVVRKDTGLGITNYMDQLKVSKKRPHHEVKGYLDDDDDKSDLKPDFKPISAGKKIVGPPHLKKTPSDSSELDEKEPPSDEELSDEDYEDHEDYEEHEKHEKHPPSDEELSDEDYEEHEKHEKHPPQLAANNAQFNADMIGDFSQVDIDNINEIVNMGADYYEVVQMYSACDKNKMNTIELLFG